MIDSIDRGASVWGAFEQRYQRALWGYLNSLSKDLCFTVIRLNSSLRILFVDGGERHILVE